MEPGLEISGLLLINTDKKPKFNIKGWKVLSMNIYRSNLVYWIYLVTSNFEDPAFYGAFEVPDPEDSDGMVRVGKKGQKMSPTYLLSQWQKGRNAGTLEHDIRNSKSETIIKIWDMGSDARLEHFKRWEDALMQESIEALATVAKEYNECQEDLMRAQNTSLPGILNSKRIVGCTTTAAAKYGDEIRTFNPDVLLVEEAGEILESHVLTALGPETSQMILIGDHK